MSLLLAQKGMKKAAGGPATEDDFLFTITTTTASEVFTIPCQNKGTFNATIDWGDGGGTSTVTAYNDADLAHTYTDAGTYQIRISGTFTNIFFNSGVDGLKVISVDNLGSVGWLSFASAFLDCTNLVTVTAGDSDTSLVGGFPTWEKVFSGCNSVTSYDLTGMDVTGDGAENFKNFFNSNLSVVTIDLTGWDTSSFRDLTNMFRRCDALTSIIGIEDWDISGITVLGTNFLTVGRMTTAQYDNLLINWEAQAAGRPAEVVSFGASTYTAGGAAATARTELVSTHGWTITDGGTA
jgi:hypothetical protein